MAILRCSVTADFSVWQLLKRIKRNEMGLYKGAAIIGVCALSELLQGWLLLY